MRRVFLHAFLCSAAAGVSTVSQTNAPQQQTFATHTVARVIDVGDADASAWIRWVDVTAQGWQLHASPLSIADVFAKQVAESGRAWIFTSATLAVGRDFSV